MLSIGNDVAKVLLALHKNSKCTIDHMEIYGYGVGAQVGAAVCRVITRRLDGAQKIPFLLGKIGLCNLIIFYGINWKDYFITNSGVEPSGAGYIDKAENHIKSGDAEYVQIIRTFNDDLYEDILNIGDANILIKNAKERHFEDDSNTDPYPGRCHAAVTLHQLVALRKFDFIASQGEDDEVIPVAGVRHYERKTVGDKKCYAFSRGCAGGNSIYYLHYNEEKCSKAFQGSPKP